MDKSTIDKIFAVLDKNIPDPKTELKYINHFTLLVAIILSAQSTDVGVNKATDKLFDIIANPDEMIALGEEGLKRYIKTIGLYNSKAKNIINLSKILLEKYDAQIPDHFDQLITLPGVGRKTANVY